MVFGQDYSQLIALVGTSFNSLWELDGVRTFYPVEKGKGTYYSFNSLWELDGVRTDPEKLHGLSAFQFPVGIRWCSTITSKAGSLNPGRTFNSPGN